jgi:hypothetical protein
MRNLCKCGCEEYAKEGNVYINGHNNRGKTPSEETKVKQRKSHLGKTQSEEHKAKKSAAMKGKNTGPHSAETKAKRSASLKGKTQSEEHKANRSISKTYTLKDWQEKYPFMFKVEDIIEDSDGNILAHCTNSNCPSSKENGGWFSVTGRQLFDRSYALNADNGCFYCSESCKSACKKFGKSAVQLQNEIDRENGKIPELPYTTKEKSTYNLEVLERADYLCEYCGALATCVHHIRPQKLEPFFSLDPDYGIACCRKCHYKYGHPTGTECSTGNLAAKIC